MTSQKAVKEPTTEREAIDVLFLYPISAAFLHGGDLEMQGLYLAEIELGRELF